MSENNVFSKLSDDVVLNILYKLEEDPRHWARIACISTKFSALIRAVCCRTKCSQSIPAVVSDLLPPPPPSSPAVWSSLYKLSVCCPGLLYAGVLLENSDFGLERELGPDENFQLKRSARQSPSGNLQENGLSRQSPDGNQPENGLARESPFENQRENRARQGPDGNQQESGLARDSVDGNQRDNRLGLAHESPSVSASDCAWSLYDDLLFDTLYSEATEPLSKERAESPESEPEGAGVEKGDQGFAACRRRKRAELPESRAEGSGIEKEECKRRKLCRPMRSHLASGVWNLSREQGNKLLASRFKDDCLYICDWPGCVHVEEKRNYMLFRGVFKNFKQSRVWQNINDWSRSKIDLNCAFCSSKQTWDLLSSFCLRSYFGFHDDGQPQVRAYVCENGHVSGAWTDWPLYT